MSVLVRVLQRNTTNRILIDWLELTHMIMEVSKSNLCGGSRLGAQREPMVQVKALRQEASILQMKSKGSLPEISLLFGGGSIFFLLFDPSTDWMRPTDSMGGNLLYSIN